MGRLLDRRRILGKISLDEREEIRELLSDLSTDISRAQTDYRNLFRGAKPTTNTKNLERLADSMFGDMIRSLSHLNQITDAIIQDQNEFGDD